MSDRKIINDPVFGFINIPKGLLYDIVCHPLLQRLTRIKQLGLSSAVYPGAQHTRFQHSLGAFHLMSETIKHLLPMCFPAHGRRDRVRCRVTGWQLVRLPLRCQR